MGCDSVGAPSKWPSQDCATSHSCLVRQTCHIALSTESGRLCHLALGLEVKEAGPTLAFAAEPSNHGLSTDEMNLAHQVLSSLTAYKRLTRD